jgi:hypothetical protein
MVASPFEVVRRDDDKRRDAHADCYAQRKADLKCGHGIVISFRVD